MGFSPDAFVQMTIQYAYRKMTGHFGATMNQFRSESKDMPEQNALDPVPKILKHGKRHVKRNLSGTEGKEVDCLNLMKKAATKVVPRGKR